MKFILSALFLVGFSLTAFGEGPGTAMKKGGCKKGLQKVSCDGVEGAKKQFFCTKKADVTDELKQKTCMKERKKMAKMKKKGKKAMKKATDDMGGTTPPPTNESGSEEPTE